MEACVNPGQTPTESEETDDSNEGARRQPGASLKYDRPVGTTGHNPDEATECGEAKDGSGNSWKAHLPQVSISLWCVYLPSSTNRVSQRRQLPSSLGIVVISASYLVDNINTRNS